MFNLKVPTLVREDAIHRALQAYSHARIYGPEFTAGDLVRFRFMSTGEGPQTDQLGTVVQVFPDFPGYQVAYVNDAGDITTWRVKAAKLARAEADA